MGNTLIPLCRLWQRTSSRSSVTYWSGRLGSARIVLMPRKDNDGESSDHTHTLFVSEITTSNTRKDHE
jgi:hypothetical protein